MPPRLAGLLNTVDVMGTRALASFSQRSSTLLGYGTGSCRNSPGNFLTKKFWRLVAFIAEWQAGYHKSPNAEKLRPIPSGYG
jgi:hypothetical protein